MKCKQLATYLLAPYLSCVRLKIFVKSNILYVCCSRVDYFM